MVGSSVVGFFKLHLWSGRDSHKAQGAESKLVKLVHRLVCSWQLAAARRVALKMGRRLCCSLVTYRLGYAPSSRLADDPF
jgi:hypothetical protein